MKILRKEIELEVEDANGEFHTYKLRFSLGAMRKFEEIHGKSILETFGPSIDEQGRLMTLPDGRPLVNFGVDVFVDLLWCGLLPRHPDIKREQVEDMFDLSDTQELTKLITNAVELSQVPMFPQDPVTEEKKKRPKK